MGSLKLLELMFSGKLNFFIIYLSSFIKKIIITDRLTILNNRLFKIFIIIIGIKIYLPYKMK